VEEEMNPTQLNRSGYKVYAKFVQDFLNKEKSFYLFKTCSDLGVTEKKLLKARLLLRQGEFHEMLNVLNETNHNEIIFFKAEINVLKSQAYAFLLDFQNATLHNMEAYALYTQVNDQFGKFISLYNLSVDFARLNLEKISLHYLELARLEAIGPNQKGLILRADACRFAKVNNVKDTVAALKDLGSILNDLNEFDRLNTITVMASTFTDIGLFDDALKLIEGVENRIFFETKNKLQLDFVLLRYLIKDFSIPAPQITSNQNLVLHLQWKFIYLLSSGQTQVARAVWYELNNMDSSFGREFCNYLGHDLFAKVLAKIYRPKVAEPSILKGKLNELFVTLQQSPLPLSKEELIESVWKIKYQEGFDARLYKLIARLRKDFKIKIVSKSNSYFITS
jgi:hypothetical protein